MNIGTWPRRRGEEDDNPLLRNAVIVKCALCPDFPPVELPVREAAEKLRQHRREKHPELPEASSRPKRRITRSAKTEADQ